MTGPRCWNGAFFSLDDDWDNARRASQTLAVLTYFLFIATFAGGWLLSLVHILEFFLLEPIFMSYLDYINSVEAPVYAWTDIQIRIF